MALLMADKRENSWVDATGSKMELLLVVERVALTEVKLVGG
jgi:hypothetical protein